jgi:hypothetical protein
MAACTQRLGSGSTDGVTSRRSAWRLDRTPKYRKRCRRGAGTAAQSRTIRSCGSSTTDLAGASRSKRGRAAFRAANPTKATEPAKNLSERRAGRCDPDAAGRRRPMCSRPSISKGTASISLPMGASHDGPKPFSAQGLPAHLSPTDAIGCAFGDPGLGLARFVGAAVFSP